MNNTITVGIFVESRYKLSRKRIREAILEELKKAGVTGPAEVSVAIIGDRKMRLLNKKYRNLDKTTNVLSFSQLEGKEYSAAAAPSEAMMLGDVVISYPQVIFEAVKEEMLVDDKISELIEHGVKHLLGLHHE